MADRLSDLEQRVRVHAALADAGRLRIVDALGSRRRVAQRRCEQSSGCLEPARAPPARRSRAPAWSSGTAPRPTGAAPTCSSCRRPRRTPSRRALRRSRSRASCSSAPRTPPAPSSRPPCGSERAPSRPPPPAPTRPTRRARGRRRRPPPRAAARSRHSPRPLADVLRADDYVVTVCDNAHEELDRHRRPGPAARPDRLHWSVPDPVPAGTDAAFDTRLRRPGAARHPARAAPAPPPRRRR